MTQNQQVSIKEILELYTASHFVPARYKSLVKFIGSTRRETRYLRNSFSNRSKLLDAGCGYGRLSIPMAKEGFHITGIDIVPYQIQLAQKEAEKQGLSIDYTIGDICALPFSDNSFDGVYSMLAVYQYLPTEEQREQAIDEFYRVLTLGGKLLISVDYSIPKFLQQFTSHQGYNQEELQRLAENAGFEDVSFSTMRLGFLLHKKLNMEVCKPM